MSKLIITTEGFDFLIYDMREHEIQHKQPKTNIIESPELEGQGRPVHRPFGIDVCEKYIYIASNNKLARFDKKDFKFDSLIDVPLYINTHQILKDDDIFYVTNTAINNIGIYNTLTSENLFLDAATFKIDSKVPNAPADSDILDQHHVNSLFAYEDKIYFCLHNHGKELSYYGCFDKVDYKVRHLIELGTCGHNIYIIHNMMYTLSTGSGELYEIDLEEKKVAVFKIADPNEVFIRGLALFNNKLIIGCSVNFKTGKKQSAYLLEMNIITKQIKQFNLPDILSINDIRLLN